VHISISNNEEVHIGSAAVKIRRSTGVSLALVTDMDNNNGHHLYVI